MTQGHSRKTSTPSHEGVPDVHARRSAPHPGPNAPPSRPSPEAYRLAVRTARSVLRDDVHEGIDAHDVAQEILLRFADLDLATIGNWRAWVTDRDSPPRPRRDPRREAAPPRRMAPLRFGRQPIGLGPVAAPAAGPGSQRRASLTPGAARRRSPSERPRAAGALGASGRVVERRDLPRTALCQRRISCRDADSDPVEGARCVPCWSRARPAPRRDPAPLLRTASRQR